VRMTKPEFVNHFTTGMFNYVVKDPDSSGLSREFWIKDQVGEPNLVSSNLIALASMLISCWGFRLPCFCGLEGFTQPACDPLSSS